MDWSKQIACVTGASRGIGREIAAALINKGATVVGTSTSERGAAAISESLGASAHGFVLNLSDPTSIDAFLAELKNADLLPTILVNNAGITQDNLSMRMKPDQWQSVLDTNLSGPFYLIQGCLRHMMRARYGRIISIGSVVGTMGNPGQANYCAAKAGLEGMSKSLARELASRNITSNTVAPGFIETDMTSVLEDEHRDTLLSTIPLGRMGTPHDIAHAVTYLVEADYVTGQCLHVNGGMVMV